jgi:arginyl-tRNA synthetase
MFEIEKNRIDMPSLEKDTLSRGPGLPMSGPLAGQDTSIRLHNSINLAVSEEIIRGLLAISDGNGRYDLERVYAFLGAPPKPEFGELALPCFQFGKDLKISPNLVAQKLSDALSSSGVGIFTAAGPYLNIKVDMSRLIEQSLNGTLSGQNFSQQLVLNPPKLMFEFSQPNTHKELHVGHMRNICLGDALTRTARYVGMPVITATFPGDVGTHVAKCLWYLKNRNTEAIPESEKGQWLGKIYTQATAALEAEANTELGEANSQALSEILRQIEAGQGEYFDLWKKTRQWSIDLMEQSYDWLNVKFDKWYWESELDSSSVESVKQLKEKGLLQDSNGAIGIDLSDANLGFCLLLKSDGNGLYATKDFLLAQRKFQEFDIDKSVYLVDMRQTHHFKQVFEALRRCGFEDAVDCFHLPYNYVTLPDGAMSSRKGNIVPLSKLIDRMQHTVKAQYLDKLEDLGAEPKEQVAKMIAHGAIKFGMNRVDPNTAIVFDMDAWLRLDGDSGPYVQYTGARIKSVIRKFEATLGDVKADCSLLNSPMERKLLATISKFNDITVKVVETLKTNLLCDYLIDLASTFNGYYAQTKVINTESKELSAARVDLCRAVLKTLERGLDCLGVNIPDRM